MNTGRFDLVHALKRLGKFALDRPAEIYLLGKIRSAETGLIKKVKANMTARYRAFACHLQPEFADAVMRDLYRRSAVRKRVGYVRRFEFLDDRLGVGRF